MKLKNSKFCQRCQKEKPLQDFYKRKRANSSNVNEPSPYCKNCTNKQTTERHKDFKQKSVKYKGGKCACCGFNKYLEALEFHHVDPKVKEISISKLRCTNFEKNPHVKKELDKCILVCSNCHKGIHAGYIQISTT